MRIRHAAVVAAMMLPLAVAGECFAWPQSVFRDALPQSHPGDMPFQITARLEPALTWKDSSWWEVIRVFGPIVGAFGGFWVAARLNYGYNRRLHDRYRNTDAASLAAALRIELTAVARDVEQILSFLQDPAHVPPNLPARDRLAPYNVRSFVVLEANLTRLSLFSPAMIRTLFASVEAVDVFREAVERRQRQTGTMPPQEYEWLLGETRKTLAALNCASDEASMIENSGLHH